MRTYGLVERLRGWQDGLIGGESGLCRIDSTANHLYNLPIMLKSNDQFVADLQQAILHPQVHVWTYRYYNQAYVGFLAPSHVCNRFRDRDPISLLPTALFMAPLQQATKLVISQPYLSKDLQTSFNKGKTMGTQEQSELDFYTDDYIQLFLESVDRLIDSAPELAKEWHEMDDEEQGIQRSAVMSDWGNRYLLGDLYRAGRLSLEQEESLAELDNALLEHARAIEIAYGPSLADLLDNLIRWGSPLFAQQSTVRVEIPSQKLPASAQALAA